MMRALQCLFGLAGFSLATAQGAFSQGLDPADILHPKTDSWPTYSGDYSGQRYSPLSEINTSNVKSLTLAWDTRLTAGTGSGAGGIFALLMGGGAPTIVGGVGTQEAPGGRVSGA